MRCQLFSWFVILLPILLVDAVSATPNIIILLADDLGYGDLGYFAHPISSTPNIDSMAQNSLVFTQFYAASSTCTPSRASILTGRYPVRSGIYPGVFNPNSKGGLPYDEITIAEFLKDNGYSTSLVGKWHLGYGENGMYLPFYHGFDEYYGIPYSHGQCPCATCFYPDVGCAIKCWSPEETVPCPLIDNTTIIQQPADMVESSDKHLKKATQFIENETAYGNPFFLLFSLYQPHVPQFAGETFTNSSVRGGIGDALSEMDWLVSKILESVQEAGVEDNTFIFFTSDQGPAVKSKTEGGNSGLLKCGKGTTYEGGHRVPAIAYWPGTIQPGRTMELASTLDILPTIASLIDKEVQVETDGYDMSGILLEQGTSNRDTMYYYPADPYEQYGVFAVRHNQYKAHFYTIGASGDTSSPDPDCLETATLTEHETPLIYDLERDPSEKYDVYSSLDATDDGKAVIETLKQLKTDFDDSVTWRESEIYKGSDDALQPCCRESCTSKPTCCRCT